MNNTNTTKTRISRKTRLLGLLGVAVSAVARVPAGASASTAKTSVDLNNMGIAGQGVESLIATVSSSKSVCETNRKVSLFVDDGNGPRKLASGTTSGNQFKTFISYGLEGNPFTAKVKRSVVSTGGKKITCAATSKTQVLD
jgi:hypothetical protein